MKHDYVNVRQNYVKMHMNTIMLHVDIIDRACMGQKYTTI